MRKISVILHFALFISFVLSSSMLMSNVQTYKKFSFVLKQVVESEESEEEHEDEHAKNNNKCNLDEDFSIDFPDKLKLTLLLFQNSSEAFYYSKTHILQAFHDLGIYSPPEQSIV